MNTHRRLRHCLKKTFVDEASAQIEIKHLSHGRRREQRDPLNRKAEKCNLCGFWHLTYPKKNKLATPAASAVSK